MARFRLVRNLLDGRVVGGRIDFSEFADQQADNLASRDGPESVQVPEEGVGQIGRGGNGEDAGDVRARVQGTLRVRGFAVTDVEDSDDGSDDAAQGQQERIGHAGAAFDGNSTQRQGGNDGAYIGLEQVSAHAGDVTDIVPDVVGDRSGVAGVVFRDAGFDFTDKVRADVRGFRVDTAADTGEECDGAGAQAEARDDVHIGSVFPEEGKGQGDTGDAQADYGQAHDGAAGEGNLQGLRHAVLGSAGRAHVGAGGNVHAAIPGQDREDSACNEADSRHRRQENRDNSSDNDDETCQGLVFTVQERHGAFVNVTGDFLHQGVAGIGFRDGAAQEGCDQQGQDACSNGKHDKATQDVIPFLFG